MDSSEQQLKQSSSDLQSQEIRYFNELQHPPSTSSSLVQTGQRRQIRSKLQLYEKSPLTKRNQLSTPENIPILKYQKKMNQEHLSRTMRESQLDFGIKSGENVLKNGDFLEKNGNVQLEKQVDATETGQQAQRSIVWKFPTEIQEIQQRAARARSKGLEEERANRKGTKYNDKKYFDKKPQLEIKNSHMPRSSEIPGLDELFAKYGSRQDIEKIVEEMYDSIIELQTQTDKSKTGAAYAANEYQSSKDIDQFENTRKSYPGNKMSISKKVHFQRHLSFSQTQHFDANQQNRQFIESRNNTLKSSVQKELQSFELHPSQLKVLDQSTWKPSDMALAQNYGQMTRQNKIGKNSDLPDLNNVYCIDDYSQDRQSSPQPVTSEVDASPLSIIKVHSQTNLNLKIDHDKKRVQNSSTSSQNQKQSHNSQLRLKKSIKELKQEPHLRQRMSSKDLVIQTKPIKSSSTPPPSQGVQKDINVSSSSCVCSICQHFHNLSKVEIKKKEPLMFLKFFKDNKTEITHYYKPKLPTHLIKSTNDPSKSVTPRDMPVQSIKLELKCFNWFMHQMLPPPHLTHHMHGCEVLFPDTAFFHISGPKQNSGFVHSIIKTDPQTQCLIMNTSSQRTNHHAVRTSFSLLVRDRWNEVAPRGQSIGLVERKSGHQMKRIWAGIDNQMAVQRHSKKSVRGGSLGYGLSQAYQSAVKRKESVGSSSIRLPSNKSLDSSIKKRKDRANGLSSNIIQPTAPNAERFSQDTVEREGRKKEEGKDATRWRDQVVMRFKQGYGLDGSTQSTYPLIKPLNELEFINIMDRRANDPFWKRIDSIQTAIKIERGPDRHFHIKFRNDKIFNLDDILNQENLLYNHYQLDEPYYNKIVSEIKETGQELEDFKYSEIQKEIERRMKKTNPMDYCWRIAFKMATYMFAVHNLVILSMEIDFYLDDNGNIWLTNVENIVIKNQHDHEEVKELSAIYLTGQRIISQIKENMEKDGLKFDEKSFIEAKKKRPMDERMQTSNQFQLLQQLEQDIDINNMPLDIRELENNCDITTLSEDNLNSAMKRLTYQQKQRLLDRIKIKKLEKLLKKIYMNHLRDFGLDKILNMKFDQEDDQQKLTAGQKNLMTESIQAKDRYNKNNTFESTDIYQEIVSMNQRDFEREIIRELRPEIDSARRLIDVIDDENQKMNHEIIDDRVVKFLERRYGTRLKAITIKHMNNLNEQLIKKYQSLMRPIVQISKSKPISPKQASSNFSFGPSQTQSVTNSRLIDAKQNFIKKLTGYNSPEFTEADMPNSFLSSSNATATKKHHEEIIQKMNQLDISDFKVKQQKESFIQEKLRKRQQRIKEQDLQVFEAKVYRDIINNKRKSMNKNELQKQRELKESILSLINQAIEVRSDQIISNLGQKNQIENIDNIDETSVQTKRGNIPIETNQKCINEDALEEKRIQLLNALNKRKTQYDNSALKNVNQTTNNSEVVDFHIDEVIQAQTDLQTQMIVSKLTSLDFEEAANNLPQQQQSSSDYLDGNERQTVAINQIRKLLTPTLPNRFDEAGKYKLSKTQQNNSIAKIMPLQVKDATKEEVEVKIATRPLSQENAKYFRKSQIIRSTIREYNYDGSIMTPNAKSVAKFIGLKNNASLMSDSRMQLPKQQKQSSQLLIQNKMRDHENSKTFEKTKSLKNPFINGRITSFAKMSKARLMASRLSNRQIYDQIKHLDQGYDTTNQETTEAASNSANNQKNKTSSIIGSQQQFPNPPDSGLPQLLPTETQQAMSLSEQTEAIIPPFQLPINNNSIESSMAQLHHSQPLLPNNQQVPQGLLGENVQSSLPMSEEGDREDSAAALDKLLIQARTKDGNVVLCDSYVAKKVKKQRNLLTQSMMVKREKRESLPWNKARQTMKKFNRDNPRFDYYDQHHKVFKNIDIATEEFLQMSGKIGERMEQVFQKGLQIPQYDEPELLRPTNLNGPINNRYQQSNGASQNFDDQNSQISRDTTTPQINPGRSAYSKNGKIPSFAAFNKGQEFKQKKHKSLQILPKNKQVSSKPNVSVISSSESKQYEINNPSMLVAQGAASPKLNYTQLEKFNQIINSSAVESRLTGTNQSLRQMKSEINKANLSSHMFFGHRKHKRIGQVSQDDTFSTNRSNKSIKERLSKLNRMTCNPSKTRTAISINKKKEINSRYRQQMKHAFQVLKSQRCDGFILPEDQQYTDENLQNFIKSNHMINKESAIIQMPNQIISSRDIDGQLHQQNINSGSTTNLYALKRSSNQNSGVQFQNTEKTYTQDSNKLSMERVNMRMMYQQSNLQHTNSYSQQKNRSQEFTQLVGGSSTRGINSGLKNIVQGAIQGGVGNSRSNFQEKKRRSMFSAPKNYGNILFNYEGKLGIKKSQSNAKKQQKFIQKYYHDRIHLKLSDISSMKFNKNPGMPRNLVSDLDKPNINGEEQLKQMDDGIQGTALSNLVQKSPLKMEVNVKVNNNNLKLVTQQIARGSKSSGRQRFQGRGELPKLKISHPHSRNPFESKFNIHGNQINSNPNNFNLDTPDGFTNFSSSRLVKNYTHNQIQPTQSPSHLQGTAHDHEPTVNAQPEVTGVLQNATNQVATPGASSFRGIKSPVLPYYEIIAPDDCVYQESDREVEAERRP